MFWGAIRSDVQKLPNKRPNKLNAAGHMEIFKKLPKNAFPDNIFQQDNAPVHKSKIIGVSILASNNFKETE